MVQHVSLISSSIYTALICSHRYAVTPLSVTLTLIIRLPSRVAGSAPLLVRPCSPQTPAHTGF